MRKRRQPLGSGWSGLPEERTRDVPPAVALAQAVERRPEAPAKGEERISLFWRVFGGTLLSIAALVVITLYQQFNGSLNELRVDAADVLSPAAFVQRRDGLGRARPSARSSW